MIKVLLVEDETGTRNLMKIIVNWAEFHMKIIGEASNGLQALLMIKDELPDLVITDIKMPIMDGLSLAEELKKQYPQIRVVIVTAYDEFQYAQKALRAGVVDFILKPLKRQEIREVLLRAGKLFDDVGEENGDVIGQIQNYLEENYADCGLSLNAVAKAYYLNPSYLSRTFKKKTGETLVEYLNRVRLEHACELIKTGDWKVYQLAEQVGIPNADYFSRCFKKYTGMTVNEYKKQNETT